MRRAGLALVCALVVLASGTVALGQLGLRFQPPEPFDRMLRRARALHVAGGYGLFAVMTTVRNEIVLEGSRDGSSWRAYEFRWKPGALDRAPSFSQPHMPRLDWQMWFAALGDCQRNPWFVEFQRRLLAGSPPVSNLLAFDPFHDDPPRYLRSTLYRYEFTDPSDPERGPRWWQRHPLAPYCPAVELRDGDITAAEISLPPPSP